MLPGAFTGRRYPGHGIIVPRLALQQCQTAVSEYPGTARFHYQLGRALEASRRMEDAIASYTKAAAMNYPMAFYSLGVLYGDGKGVPANIAVRNFV